MLYSIFITKYYFVFVSALKLNSYATILNKFYVCLKREVRISFQKCFKHLFKTKFCPIFLPFVDFEHYIDTF